MAKRPASPSPSVDVRGWLGGIRFSGFTAIMLALVVLAVFVLVPTIGTYVEQRQKIVTLSQSVHVTRDEIAQLQQQRERWKDPAYITTQARARLFYVKPGDVVYLIDDDLPAADAPKERRTVSDEVETTRTDWMSQLVRSVTATGLSHTATTDEDGRTHPSPSPTHSR